MADPFTMTAISIGTAIAGAGVSAYGASKQGSSSAAMYQYQSGVAKQNAEIAKQNANYERYVGEIEAQRVGMKGRAEAGAIRAKQSASNLDITSGTAEKVQDSHALLTSHDQTTTRANAARRAYGYEIEALREQTQSQLYNMASSNAKSAGMISAVGSLISGASSVSSKWLQGNASGVFASGVTSGPNSLGGKLAWGST